jgi:hypothetical protein
MGLHNVKEKPADQTAIERATTKRTHVLSQLNRCGWEQLIFNKTG